MWPAEAREPGGGGGGGGTGSGHESGRSRVGWARALPSGPSREGDLQLEATAKLLFAALQEAG